MSTPATDEADRAEFAAWIAAVEPRLRRALVGAMGVDRAGDAVAEALAWAWEHWGRARELEHPAPYLFRVALSRSRRRRQGWLRAPEPGRLPEIEPGLVSALLALPTRQRECVWLVHGCGWTHVEVGEALGISASTVANHVNRGMDKLRTRLGVVSDV
ncbi:MAG: sigma-70 family RNA polymerase sigma factor [Actinomycetota bacterium]